MRRLSLTHRRGALLRILGSGATACCAVAALVLAPAAPATAATAPHWVVRDLGTLQGGRWSEATAINTRGDVVGSSGAADGRAHAVLWRDGHIRDLGRLPGGGIGTAAGINDRGEIVGSAARPGGDRAVLWRGGRVIDLGTLGGARSYAVAINNRGEVIGGSETASGALHAFLWRGGRMRDLGTWNGGFARVAGINDAGVVVGEVSVDGMNSVPARLFPGGVTPLVRSLFGTATAVNDWGLVTGYAFGGKGSFVWYRGHLTMLASLPGAAWTQALDVNDRGQVVGGTDYDGFIWQHGRMSALPRFHGNPSSARAINDRGEVAGSGCTRRDGLDPHAVLWVPSTR